MYWISQIWSIDGRLVDWLIVSTIDWRICWLIDWLFDYIDWLVLGSDYIVIDIILIK